MKNMEKRKDLTLMKI